MNKKYLLTTVIILLVAGATVFYFLQQKPAPTKFFPASEVSDTDLIVTIDDTSVNPAELAVKKGQRVIFINKSKDFAWPASNPHPTHTDYPEFDPREPLDVNEAWSFTFTNTGEWKHHDHLKPSRRGVIRVTE
jgi:plastocyanin